MSYEDSITLKELLEILLETRNTETLKLLDERYQKGFKDAIDVLIKWFSSPKHG